MSTVTEILEQAKKLTQAERDQLLEELRVMQETSQSEAQTGAQEEHWGKSLNALLDEIGPIEMKYPEIEDPVEWVKHLRSEMRRRRLGDWGEEDSQDEME
jgi:hypothetical protein